MTEKEGHTFPPFVSNGTGVPPVENLTRALGRILTKDEWAGVPDPQSIAAALRQLLARSTFEDQRYRQDRWPELIAALVEALERATKDGWRLELIGPRKRPPMGFAKRIRDFEIGLFFEERKASGYEAALTDTKTEFGVSHTTIKEAHRKFVEEYEADNRWLSELRDHMKNGTGPFASD